MRGDVDLLLEELRAHVRELAESVRDDSKISELVKMHAALNALERTCGIERTPLSEMFGYRASALPFRQRN
jgi:hypothetical protein